jgi:hypothetical protein
MQKPSGFQLFENRFRLSGRGKAMALPVTYDRTTILAHARRYAERHEVEPVLQHMVPVYRRLAGRHADLVFWQLTAFESGLQSIYPAVTHVPMRYNALKSGWYRRAVEENASGWTLPAFDPHADHFEELRGKVWPWVSMPTITTGKTYAAACKAERSA